MNRHNLIAAIMITGLLWHACAGTQSNTTGTMSSGTLITPELFNKITSIEWHLTKMTMDNESISLVLEFEQTK